MSLLDDDFFDPRLSKAAELDAALRVFRDNPWLSSQTRETIDVLLERYDREVGNKDV